MSTDRTREGMVFMRFGRSGSIRRNYLSPYKRPPEERSLRNFHQALAGPCNKTLPDPGAPTRAPKPTSTLNPQRSTSARLIHRLIAARSEGRLSFVIARL